MQTNDEFKLSTLGKISNLILYYFGPALLILFFIAPSIGSTSALSIGLNFSPDSLDWVIEGRALINGTSDPLPILRNPGYLFFSLADSAANAKGWIFLTSNILGLLLQWFAFVLAGKWLNANCTTTLIILVAYFLAPIHFISTYLLSDGLSVGIIMFSSVLIWYGIARQNNKFLAVGAILSSFGFLIQMYAIAPLLFGLTYQLFKSFSNRNIKNYLLVSGLIFLALISLLLKNMWEVIVAHESRPKQLELLSISIDMFPFYMSVWFYLFFPIIIATLLLAKQIKDLFQVTFLSHEYKQYWFIIFFQACFLLILSFFYQWEESRFSYSYSGLIYLSLIPFGVTVTQKCSKNVKKIASSSFLISSILIGIVFTPANSWSMKLFEIDKFNPWFLQLYPTNQQYEWVENLISENCKIGNQNKIDEPTNSILTAYTDISSYEKVIIEFSLKNCLH